MTALKIVLSIFALAVLAGCGDAEDQSAHHVNGKLNASGTDTVLLPDARLGDLRFKCSYFADWESHKAVCSATQQGDDLLVTISGGANRNYEIIATAVPQPVSGMHRR